MCLQVLLEIGAGTDGVDHIIVDSKDISSEFPA